MLNFSSVDNAERIIVEPFEYANDTMAQSMWTSPAGCLPVGITPHDTAQGKTALQMKCDFSQRQDRCYWDKEVSLDLSKFGTFNFWIYVENPQAINSGTLYFQSGSNWYSGAFPVGSAKWHKVTVRKSGFRSEGSPTGWRSINRIRISFWKASNIDTNVAIDNLEAVSSKIAIIMSDKSQSDSARNTADFMAKVLERAGLEFGVLTDTDVESGVLSDIKLAIFPYNPNMSDKEIDAVVKFVNSGGKIMFFYSLPDKIADLLGIENGGWSKGDYESEFFSIHFESDVDGLPKMINQGSWNVTIPKSKNSTKIMGKWVDPNGKVSEKPAMTINRNGTFMGHILMQGDISNKGQMLLALIGELVPDMRPSLSEAVLQNRGKVAGLEDMNEALSLIEDNMEMLSKDRQKETKKRLEEAEKLFDQAKKAQEKDHYGDVLKLSKQASEKLQEAFISSFPSKKDEFRALWCHSAFGIGGWTWDKAIENVKKSNFNNVVPNMLWGGLTYYPSDVLPVDPSVEGAGDQIALCLDACRKHDVKMHVWKVNWNLSNAPAEFVEKMSREGRLQVDIMGNETKWLCPSNEKNYKLELDSLLEIVRKYDVDGIHFDYIRYPNSNSCYCPVCRENFEKSIGEKVPNFPQDVITGKYAEKYIQFRCDNITRLVRDVSKQAKEINPKIEISAAVFNDYPNCRRSVGQDWKLWIESGYLDFVCPMDYTDDNERFRNMVLNQEKVVNGLIPLYPGVGASAPGLSADQVAMQIHIARESGADGFIIFNYDLPVATGVLPALIKGVTAER